MNASVPAVAVPHHLRRPAARTVFLLLAAACLTPWVGPPTALAAGVALAILVGNPFAAESRRISKPLLQASVVLLGFGMDLPSVLRAGAGGAGFAAGTILLTLGLAAVVGRLLKVDRDASALIGGGTAICGGSAIAALSGVIAADEAAISVAMGTVFILNAVALYLFPPLGHLLGLSQTQFGTWAGVAIHDVSSVVGAAGVYGRQALETATAVKLSRALWIVPVCVVAGVLHRRRLARKGTATGESTPAKRAPVPWFIGLFLLASVARTFVPGVASAAPVLTLVATHGLTLTLFLIGAGLSAATLRKTGWRPLAQGLILWGFISVLSLAVILAVG